LKTEIHTEIVIDAPPSAVWRVLTDAAGHRAWNPFIRHMSGELRAGETLEVEIAPPGGRVMTFKPRVLAVRPERELRWLGRVFVRGLFDGEHRFQLEPLAGGGTRFVQSERFGGVLVRPLRRTLDRTLDGFEQMNRALKAKVEADRRP
jgi:hypothetical protein